MSKEKTPGRWVKQSSKLVYDGAPWLKVYSNTVQTDAGRVLENFHAIETFDFALVYALDREDNVLMIEQYRPGTDNICLCFPGGHIDAGETATAACARESMEETGYEVEALAFQGRLVTHSNFGAGWGSFFTGHVRRRRALERSDIEPGLVRWIPQYEIRALIATGKIATAHDATCALLGLTANGQGTREPKP